MSACIIYCTNHCNNCTNCGSAV